MGIIYMNQNENENLRCDEKINKLHKPQSKEKSHFQAKLKEYSNWPTFVRKYLNLQKFVNKIMTHRVAGPCKKIHINTNYIPLYKAYNNNNYLAHYK